MRYRFAENKNFEDLSCGRVIRHGTGNTNFSVRLADEIFMRCMEYIGTPEKKVRLYDPCCGGGYLLTVLGFLHNDKIGSIRGSDISDNSISVAADNFNLLTSEGLSRRRDQLMKMYIEYGKESHNQAIGSVKNLSDMLHNNIKSDVFKRDILDSNDNAKMNFIADIIITDVPYSNMVSWSNDTPFAIDAMLDNLLCGVNDNTILAVCSDKRQKIYSPGYKRVEKFQTGVRKIEILKKLEQ